MTADETAGGQAAGPPAGNGNGARSSAHGRQPRLRGAVTPVHVLVTRPGEPADPAGASASPEVKPAPALVLRGQPGPITVSDSFAIAGRKAAWLHIRRLLDLEPALRDASATDSLKRYRVAVRRLRSALRAFAGAYPPDEVRWLRSRLATLGDTVGAVRDLDVRIADVARRAEAAAQARAEAEAEAEGGAGAEAGPGPGADVNEAATSLAPLLRVWRRQRELAAGAMHRHLASQRHRRLLERLVEFAEAAPGTSGRGLPERATGDRVGSTIWMAYEQVRAYGQIVRWADLPTLHGLRVEAKRLRYALEFLAAVLGPERGWLVERLVALQDHLGALNDASLTAGAVRAFLSEHHASLAPAERAAIEAYLVDREREAVRLRRGVGRVWRPIASITFARRLGRAVVGGQPA